MTLSTTNFKEENFQNANDNNFKRNYFSILKEI